MTQAMQNVMMERVSDAYLPADEAAAPLLSFQATGPTGDRRQEAQSPGALFEKAPWWQCSMRWPKPGPW